MKRNPISEVKVLDHGIVALMMVSGDDMLPADVARTSYRNEDDKTDEQNIGLTDYMTRHAHATPFEFPDVSFYMVLPLAIAAQLKHHRSARMTDPSINEESLRYVEAREEMYVPPTDRFKKKSETNKQGSSMEVVVNSLHCQGLVTDTYNVCSATYRQLIREGVAPEVARFVLPVAQYTSWWWKVNLRQLFEFMALRLDTHAQEEIRVYAKAMYDQVQPIFPNCFKSWENHVLNAVKISSDELEIFLSYIDIERMNMIATAIGAELGTSRQREFIAKVGTICQKKPY